MKEKKKRGGTKKSKNQQLSKLIVICVGFLRFVQSFEGSTTGRKEDKKIFLTKALGRIATSLITRTSIG